MASIYATASQLIILKGWNFWDFLPYFNINFKSIFKYYPGEYPPEEPRPGNKISKSNNFNVCS